MRGHKISLIKFKKIEVISSIFSNHNWYETKNKRKAGKSTITQKLHTLPKNQWVKKEIKREIKNLDI